jgi:hypothetical protein
MGAVMIYVHDGVFLDPSVAPPQIFIQTNGLVVEKHRILLPARNGTERWEADGTNIPLNSDDPGTPDIYLIPEFTRQAGNLLEIFIDLFNVHEVDRKFSLRVEIHQADYEPDVLFDEHGKLGAVAGERTCTFGVFVPLRLMA